MLFYSAALARECTRVGKVVPIKNIHPYLIGFSQQVTGKNSNYRTPTFKSPDECAAYTAALDVLVVDNGLEKKHNLVTTMGTYSLCQTHKLRTAKDSSSFAGITLVFYIFSHLCDLDIFSFRFDVQTYLPADSKKIAFQETRDQKLCFRAGKSCYGLFEMYLREEGICLDSALFKKSYFWICGLHVCLESCKLLSYPRLSIEEISETDFMYVQIVQHGVRIQRYSSLRAK